MLNFGFIGGGSSGENICFDSLANVGTVYSSDVTPTHAADGTEIYNIQFDTSTGIFIAQFGAAGDELLSDTLNVTISYGGDSVELYWDEVNDYYTGTNTTLATALALEVGNQVCFSMSVDNAAKLLYWTDGTNQWVDDETPAIEWVLDNASFATDENGDYLYDDNGHVIYA